MGEHRRIFGRAVGLCLGSIGDSLGIYGAVSGFHREFRRICGAVYGVHREFHRICGAVFGVHREFQWIYGALYGFHRGFLGRSVGSIGVP